jgi:hypothetical protein
MGVNNELPKKERKKKKKKEKTNEMLMDDMSRLRNKIRVKEG